MKNEQLKKNYKLTVAGIFVIGFIFICSLIAWFILGGAVYQRTSETTSRLGQEVAGTWGSQLTQAHPQAWFQQPTGGDKGRRLIAPAYSDIQVSLRYEPKPKGLIWYRTYEANFQATYEFPNPAPIAQTIYVQFQLPESKSSYHGFAFQLGEEKIEDVMPVNGKFTKAITVPANGKVPLQVSYQARGLDRWNYSLGDAERIRNFRLLMDTDFHQIDFPQGSGSATERTRTGDGWQLVWNYPDVIGPQPIAMAMPKQLNAGPVAARMSFFAPVSLLFFFSVLLILGSVRNAGLHPMHYFLLAAGCFSFQLLFAYMVDRMPIYLAFLIAGGVSVVLVSGYIHAVAGARLSAIALPAQLAFMGLFSYTFFFDGLTGLTIAIGAVITLAVLMLATAKVDWDQKFQRKPKATLQPPAITPDQAATGS